MKDAYYFPHDSNARMDIRIIELRNIHGWAGYGIYWGIIEVLRDQDSYRFEAEKKHLLNTCLGCAYTDLEPVLSTCVEVGLLAEKDGYLFSPSLTRRMERVDNIREKRRLAGAKGGSVKQSLSNAKANAKQVLSIKEKKRKEKERKGKEIKVKDTTTLQNVDESDDSPTSGCSVPAKDIFESWNEVWDRTSIPRIREFTKARRAWIKREYNRQRETLSTVDDFRKFFEYLRDDCPFIRDSVASGKTWFSFDWLFKWENNFAKALEGNYERR